LPEKARKVKKRIAAETMAMKPPRMETKIIAR
jgi:hypothetical protein